MKVSFRYGLDGGKGGVILIDDEVIHWWTNDVWWEENWDNQYV